jgi:hypothetical protein
VYVKSWFSGEKETYRFGNTRLITVRFTGASIDVSPVLYFNFFEAPRFALSQDGSGWVSYIEKAYAVLRGTHAYERLNNLDPGLAMFDMVGLHHKVEIDDADHATLFRNTNEVKDASSITDLDSRNIAKELGNLLADSKRRATIATTPSSPGFDLVGDHTYVVLSFDASTKRVRLFEAMRASEPVLTLDEFRQAFDAVYQAVSHPACK